MQTQTHTNPTDESVGEAGSGPCRQGKRPAEGAGSDGDADKRRKGEGVPGGSSGLEEGDVDGGSGGGELPGPKLGTGPRWNLKGALAGRKMLMDQEKVEKELALMEERSISFGRMRDVLSFIKDMDDGTVWKEILEAMDDRGPTFSQKDLARVEEMGGDLGDGGASSTREYIHDLEAEIRTLRAGSDARCKRMLQQALSGSEDADVEFVFAGGSHGGIVRGHRGMLCAGSEEYGALFRSGMVEAQEGKIRVPPCVGMVSFRGFLEWLYLGRGGEECAKADGRELWLLGEMYEVAGLREWLLEEGIDGESVYSVYEFALVAEGVDREAIMAKCMDVMKTDGEVGVADSTLLRQVGRDAVKGLALTRARHGKWRRMEWRYVRDGFRMLEGWLKANGGVYDVGQLAWFRGLVCDLDMGCMPLKAMNSTIQRSRYVDGAWADSIVARKQAAGDNIYEVEYMEERRYDLGADSRGAWAITLDGQGPEQRMAVVDRHMHRVYIIHLESGARVATTGLGWEGVGGPGQLERPWGVAFSAAGDLYVSDYDLHKIFVFDKQGRYVREFGGPGTGQGLFEHPQGLCFTDDGYLAVADWGNDVVQVLKEDGTIVRSIGSTGSQSGLLIAPFALCSMQGGGFAVMDTTQRVQVFDAQGGFVRGLGSRGKGPGQFQKASSISVGVTGEIIVADALRRDVQVFSGDGRLLQVIGERGDSKVCWTMPPFGVAAGPMGQLFVSNGTSISMLS